MSNKISQLRMIGNIEGWSYLALLFVAMPLKYIFGIALAVKIVGMMHGVLFMVFLWILIDAYARKLLSPNLGSFAFFASLVPFGTFFLNKKLLRLQADFILK